MFKNTFQSGFLSILYSIGSKPLQIWDKGCAPRHSVCDNDELDVAMPCVHLEAATQAG